MLIDETPPILEKCARALYHAEKQEKNLTAYPQSDDWIDYINRAKAVLDAAGVKY